MGKSNQLDNEYLKSISELKDMTFHIPSYQRGYRWGKREIKALLEDICDFSQIQNQQEFYCLQPVVVQKDNTQYNVIDGQQRLTTIFLIIKFIQNKDFFTIKYQTRLNSAEFLKNIQNKNKGDAKNIDFHHFVEAYSVIKDFFQNRNLQEFLDTLLDKCKVLWYEIKDEKEEDVFVQLNIGKIPLTQAENIKALFLSKNDELDSRVLEKRADFLYKSELKVREERDFRYCVLSKIDEQDIVKDEQNKPVLKDDISRIEVYLRAIVPYSKDKDYLFDYFYKSYKDKSLNQEWEKLHKAIRTLSGFASRGTQKIDREIFHYLGFLILNDERIENLYQQWQQCKDKETFAQNLFEKIKMKISLYPPIEELTYNEKKDRGKLQSILLLFNLDFLIKEESSNKYFEFNRFVLEKWSLEHIYAQKSQSIKEAIKNKNNEEIAKWLEEVLQYIQNEELKKQIKKSLSKHNFKEKLFGDIDEDFINDDILHKIQNLTLLDKDSNSKIGNHIFSQKRRKIKELADQDKLIPICTEKVFEKVFSTQKDNPNVFTQNDQNDYLEAIKSHLNKYMKDG